MSEGFGAGEGDFPLDLPPDRGAADEAMSAIAAANRAVEDIVGPEPVAWLARLRARKLTQAEADRLLERVDWALSTLDAIERRVDFFLPRQHPSRPEGIGTTVHFLASIRDLAARDREAGICARLAAEDPREIDTLVDDIRHLAHTRRQLAEALDGADAGEAGTMSAVLAASSGAERLRVEHECADLDEARERLEALLAQDDAIRSRVRALSAFADRLDTPKATLGELASLASALTCAKAAHPRTLANLREIRSAPEGAVERACERKSRIERAVRMLDNNFGPGWRDEPLEKLRRAAQIAGNPGDARIAKVRAYASGIGIDARVAENLATVVKTRQAIDAFETDEALKAAMPNAFRGMLTDFGVLVDAARLRAEILGLLGECASSAKLMAIFTTNSRVVVNEFLEFAGLEDEARALPFPFDTPLETVRQRHDAAKESLSASIAAVSALPVPKPRRTVSEARRVGRMAREVTGTEARVTGHPALGRLEVEGPEEVLAAVTWRESVASLLPAPHTPSSDLDFAALLVNAREVLAVLAEWRQTLAWVAGLLGREDLAEDGASLASVRDGLESLRAFETAIHAQVHVCEKMASAIDAGLRGFLARAAGSGTPATSWPAMLRSEYEALDRMEAEAALASELAQAADDALADSGGESGTVLSPAIADDIDQWFVEEIRGITSARGEAGTAS
jgi:hypothetical protein